MLRLEDPLQGRLWPCLHPQHFSPLHILLVSRKPLSSPADSPSLSLGLTAAVCECVVTRSGLPGRLVSVCPLEAALAPLCPVPCLCLGPWTERSLLPSHALRNCARLFSTLYRALMKTAFCPMGCWGEISVDTALCHKNTKQSQSGLTRED